jgi:hypothetical protein
MAIISLYSISWFCNGKGCLLRGTSFIFNLMDAIQLRYISRIDKYTDIPPHTSIHLFNSINILAPELSFKF